MAECQVHEIAALPFDLDGACSYKLNYYDAPMRSTQDGRPWGKWVTSSRAGFDGYEEQHHALELMNVITQGDHFCIRMTSPTR